MAVVQSNPTKAMADGESFAVTSTDVAHANLRAGLRRFDQFDFRDMFADVRSVAIVGNAAAILEYQNGALIDGHDMVVRFNRAQTAGLEDKIGSRTDLLVANEKNRLDIAPSPAETLKPRCVLSFTIREPGFDITPFRRWVGDDIPTLCCPPPDIIGFEQADRTRLLTQGSYTLYFLLNTLCIERLFLTGFTMFGAGPGGSQKYYEPRKHKLALGTYHDLDQEPRLFCDFLASFKGALQVTEEVSGLLKQLGRRDLAEGPRVQDGRLPTLTWSERFRARLAHKLLQWGARMRRSVEKSNRAVFESIKR